MKMALHIETLHYCLFVCLFVFGPGKCSGIIPGRDWGTDGVPEIKSGLAVCEARSLP